MLTTGTVLQSRYRIVSLLGQGGMGAVYRAWHLTLNMPLAIKEMVPQPELDTQMLGQLRQQFQQEAAVLARLNHPNLVRVIDHFEEEGSVYLVMDFVEGESLADRIAREGALPEDEVLAWAGQLLDALDHCHGQGMIHRDIKPQNVIVRPDGRVVLVDFGLVKLWNVTDPRDGHAGVRAAGAVRHPAGPHRSSLRHLRSRGHTVPRTDGPGTDDGQRPDGGFDPVSIGVRPEPAGERRDQRGYIAGDGIAGTRPVWERDRDAGRTEGRSARVGGRGACRGSAQIPAGVEASAGGSPPADEGDAWRGSGCAGAEARAWVGMGGGGSPERGAGAGRSGRRAAYAGTDRSAH